MKKQRLPIFTLKFLLPLIIIIGGIVVVGMLVSAGPKVKPKPKKAKLPGVEILVASSEEISIPVHTRGTVNPSTQIQLTSEVNGSVIRVSPKLSNGSYFRKGDWLLKVDRSQHEMELEKAQAQEASARVNLLMTRASKKSGNIEGIKVGPRSELARGIPQLQEAEANFNAAQSAVKLSRRQLEKTTIVAPFDGRVLKKAIDIKEYAAAGKPVAQVYATDKAEVRLPLSSAQLELVDVPSRYAEEKRGEHQPIVVLEDSSHKYTWQGRIVRSEGNIDPSNRLTYVIAQIKEPYARDPNQPERPPLSAGTFVSAAVQGRSHSSIVSIPLSAVHNMDEIRTLDEENRLHVKKVEVLYRGKDRAYVKRGIEDGARIVLTPLEIVVENMEVVVLSEAEPLAPIISEDQFARAAATNESSSQPAQNKSASVNSSTNDTEKSSAPAETPINPDDMAGMMGDEQESDIQ